MDTIYCPATHLFKKLTSVANTTFLSLCDNRQKHLNILDNVAVFYSILLYGGIGECRELTEKSISVVFMNAGGTLAVSHSFLVGAKLL